MTRLVTNFVRHMLATPPTVSLLPVWTEQCGARAYSMWCCLPYSTFGCLAQVRQVLYLLCPRSASGSDMPAPWQSMIVLWPWDHTTTTGVMLAAWWDYSALVQHVEVLSLFRWMRLHRSLYVDVWVDRLPVRLKLSVCVQPYVVWRNAACQQQVCTMTNNASSSRLNQVWSGPRDDHSCKKR